ncbi:MAG: glycosyltransferase family 2 protein [Clostridiales bacterium]|nr:glycosyltransferase family 2 protein [Clostridiales bacterium]
MKQENEVKVLIIIPAYNEAGSIEKVTGNLIENYPQYDYVIVNDGSTDDTRKICHRNDYNYIDLPVNLGLAGAMRAGMRYANYYDYDYAIQLDGDGQHDPLYIKDMLARMEETSCDIVIGSRFVSEKKPKSLRMLGSNIIGALIKLTTRHRINDVTSGMRLFNKKMIKQFGYDMHYSPEPDTLAFLLNSGVEIEEVQVRMYERVAGKSYLNFWSSIGYMVRMIFSIVLFQWVRIRRNKKCR